VNSTSIIKSPLVSTQNICWYKVIAESSKIKSITFDVTTLTNSTADVYSLEGKEDDIEFHYQESFKNADKQTVNVQEKGSLWFLLKPKANSAVVYFTVTANDYSVGSHKPNPAMVALSIL